jgi:hypothetical protein
VTWDALFRSALSGWQWALLALVPPAILALYFLKLRRKPLVVPSTYLWKKSIEDLHVNSLWQRLRKSILLFLQLLLVLLAMLSLLRPGWQTFSLTGDRFIIMIDNSASMQATDFEGSRLAAAITRAHALVDQMPTGAEAMLMTFASRPQVLQEFTTNRNLLDAKIDEIRPTYGTTQLREALEIVSGIANPPQVKSEFDDTEFQVVEDRPATVYILSDGRFPSVEGFSLGNLVPKFIPLGTDDASNLAVTMFNTRPSEVRPGERQAFAEISNFSPADTTATAQLYLEGALHDAKDISIPAGGAAGVAFSLADVLGGALRLEIGAEGTGDVLNVDDVGYAAVNNARRGKVLVLTDRVEVLRPALSTERVRRAADVDFQEPEYLRTDAYKQAAAADTYDLIVYDRCRPAEGMPRANTLFCGVIPGFAPWTPAEGEAGSTSERPPEPPKVSPVIVDWNRAHPLMAFVELGDVLVAESFVLDVPLGGTSLIEAGQGTIFAVAPRENFQDAVLGFSLVTTTEGGEEFFNTDWPQRPSFPTFWLNVMEYFAGQMDEVGDRAVRPGEAVEFTVEQSPERVTVVSPAGLQSHVVRDRSGFYHFQATDELGHYEVRHRDQTVFRFAVNLFDRDESNVALRVQTSTDAEDGAIAPVRIGFQDVQAETEYRPVRREAWRWFLLAALAVLVVEWYIYNRRAYI